jgi:TonB family protein
MSLERFALALILSVSATCTEAAQFTQDSPATAVPETCKPIDFNFASLTERTRVDLSIRVSEFGRPISATPISAVENSSLLRATIESALSCKYQPALSSGKPIEGTARTLHIFSQAKAAPPLGKPAGIVDISACAPTAADYPAVSKRLSETGTTRINFTVDHKGRLTAYGVAKSSGSLRLDFAALARLATCRFHPGTAPDGSSTSASFEVEYVWQLD